MRNRLFCLRSSMLRSCTLLLAILGWASRGAHAEVYDSFRVALANQLEPSVFGSSEGNSCWGYVSPSGREYALMGLDTGTAFVEVTNPSLPVIVKMMAGPVSIWRDIKVYGAYAYAVSEGGSGIQVFNMSSIDSGSVTLVATVLDGGTTATHTVALDEASGFLYRCGGGNEGLRIYDLSNPALPVFVGEWDDYYVHEAQIVTYVDGPYAGRQIAFCCGGSGGGFSNTGLYIVDVTDKVNPVTLSYLPYYRAAYSHQGWLSDDRRFFYLDDEFDEGTLNIPTNTHVIDVSDLYAPVEVSNVSSGISCIDHNQYVKGRLLFQSNYTSGLRIFDLTDPIRPVQIGYFDTDPDSDGDTYNGLWSNYPFFPSGTVIGSDIERGLFVFNVEEAVDCNANGFDDAADIANGSSADSDGNRIPDECQTVLSVPSQYATIQSALDAAGLGDMIVLADGTYSGSGNYSLDFHGKVVTLKSENGPENCVIDAQGLGRVIYMNDGESFGTIVDGVTLRGGSNQFGGGIQFSNSGGVIRNCILTSNTSDGLGGAVYGSSSSFLITNCRIIDNDSEDGGGVFFDSCIATLRHSLIAGNRATELSGGGVYIRGSVGPVIENCTIVDNSAIYRAGGVYVVGGDPTIRSCIVRGNTAPEFPEAYVITGETVKISYSDVAGGYAGEGNVDVDPLFVDADGPDDDAATIEDNNYHLLPASPCIDGGYPSFLNVPEEFDLDFQSRLNGRVDIGADEYFLSPCPADANGDLIVDPLDYGYVLARFGCTVGIGNPDCDAADTNGDGIVDPLDGGYVQARFGACE